MEWTNIGKTQWMNIKGETWNQIGEGHWQSGAKYAIRNGSSWYTNDEKTPVWLFDEE